MEAVINGLLSDFEKGKMTRRQLIQSLALAAAAAAPVATVGAQTASTIPAATAPPVFKTVWLDHISYAVTDYRKSTAFYRDLMGWEIRNDNGKNQCTMKIGDIGEIRCTGPFAMSAVVWPLRATAVTSAPFETR